ncbi:MAG: hypothetical protein OXF19_03525 [Hyphomicrobiales bacterium]|nr:hypothetical protein [Hyphomicrobiales bacterium]
MNERRGNVGGNYQAVTGESGIDGIMTVPAKSSRENLATNDRRTIQCNPLISLI